MWRRGDRVPLDGMSLRYDPLGGSTLRETDVLELEWKDFLIFIIQLGRLTP